MTSEQVILSEVAFLARHLHWPLAELLALEGPQRRWFVEEVRRQDDAAYGGG